MTKSELRAFCRSKRQHMTEDDYRMQCRNILVETVSIAEILHATNVLSYWPKIRAREIDTRPLNCWLRARGSTVLLPIIEPNVSVNRMHWGEFDRERNFVVNRWGISEPSVSSTVASQEIDVVLVPGLGFDIQGYRVGYGGGFYDRLFTSLKAFKIGLTTDACLHQTIPAESHDIPVDLIVTPSKTLVINEVNAEESHRQREV